MSKEAVRDFWDEAACGEELLLSDVSKEGYTDQTKKRFEAEPFIPPFANFNYYAQKHVLEIGVGLGADHQRFSEAGAILFGIDLTERAIQHTKTRFDAFGLHSELSVGDAEALDFNDGSFDLVYSWGCIHHSPDTEKVISEIYRVLRPGGEAKIMIYNKWSIVGLMLWFRYALLTGRWRMSISEVYRDFMESPGTKAYTSYEAQRMFSEFAKTSIKVELTHSDLLTSGAGQRHGGPLLSFARKVWPRFLIKVFLRRAGLFMLITATKGL